MTVGVASPMFMTPDDCAEGGAAAGAFLQSLGRFDLSQLSPDEWSRFCCILVSEANRAAGKRFIDCWTVPFDG